MQQGLRACTEREGSVWVTVGLERAKKIDWWLDVEYFREAEGDPQGLSTAGRVGAGQEYKIQREGPETKMHASHRHAPRDLLHPNRSHLFLPSPKM